MNEHIESFWEARIGWLYPIYVPSYTRAGVAPLLNILSDAPTRVQQKVTIIVRAEERAEYHKAYPWASLAVVKEPGLGPARMRALRHADNQWSGARVVMLDDDIQKLSLLEKTTNDKGERYARRYSNTQTGLGQAEHFWRSLAVACRVADGVFNSEPLLSYGAARNALFAGPVADPDIAAMVYQQSFPSCVMFFDLDRFPIRRLPKEFHFYGEDLCMFLSNMDWGRFSFHMPCVAYDQSVKLETTIPLDPTSSEGRRIDLVNAQQRYPELAQYLRESVKNPAGGVMRIGMNWQRWRKDTGTEPLNITLKQAIKESK